MRKIIILFLIFLPLLVLADEKVTEEDVKQYAKENKVKCERDSITFCTAMYCGNGYYNEEGKYINPELCNTCKYIYTCSDGKVFELEYKTD